LRYLTAVRKGKDIENKIKLLWNKFCDIFGFMSRKEKDIHVRHFSGSSVPVGSVIGRVLINSKDSRKISTAIRAAIKGETQTVKLSESTKQALKAAKAH